MTKTIKGRLLVSNILMVALPVTLTFVLFLSIFYLFIGRFGQELINSQVAHIPVEKATSSLVGQEFPQSDKALVYQLASGQTVLLLPEEMQGRFEDIEEAGNGKYLDLSVISANLYLQTARIIDFQYLIIPLILAVLLLFALLANRLLTRFVFRPIYTSLDVLVEGVEEIREGNLSYRIEQKTGNEFDTVYVDFNEMALRLQEMVEQKQADEQNRKELIAGISHDLRTPLTSIKTYVEGWGLGMANTPEKQAKYLATIKNKTDDIEHIIKQLFLFSKLDIGEFPMNVKETDAGKWLSAFVADIQEEYEQKGLQVELRENVQGTNILIDSVQLKNVLLNVAENSVKYGRKTGGRLLIDCQKTGNKLNIRLSDNGSGVPEESLAQLFHVFYRTDKARNNPSQGSGLGLAISAKLIEGMKGEISASNQTGDGLAILIQLPIIERKNQQ